MTTINSWSEVFTGSFQDAWLVTINFLPQLIAALIIFIVGWIVAAGIGKLVAQIIKKIGIDKALEKVKFYELFDKVGLKFSVSKLLGWLVKWFIIIVVLIAVAESLGLSEITNFLNQVVLFLPNIIVAVVMLIIGVVLGNFVRELIIKATQNLKSQTLIAGLAKWSIVVFSFMAALVQLRVAESLIQTLFTGFVAMLAIAGGLAFGLGGKEEAQKILQNLRKDISRE